MKNITRCHDTQYVPKSRQDVIRFDFLTDDRVTPSSSVIRLGDQDPMTGDPITDVTVFSGYYKQVNEEVSMNLDQIRIKKTKKERRKTNELKAVLSAEFEKEHGYQPTSVDLRMFVEEVEGSPYILVPVDSFQNDDDDGDSGLESWSPYSEPFKDPFEDETSLMISALRSVSGSLDGRLKDFFNILQKKCETGEGKVKMLDLAAELNVSPAAITKMKKRLAAAIQAKAAELADE